MKGTRYTANKAAAQPYVKIGENLAHSRPTVARFASLAAAADRSHIVAVVQANSVALLTLPAAL
jgi:hypothetical protein